MKKSILRKAIFGNIMMIAIASMMLVATTFAWFTLTDSANTEQTLIIGKFNIKLDDEVATYSLSHNINNTAVVPSTRTDAYALIDGTSKANVYKFIVDNNHGGIDAKYRIKVAFTESATDGTTTVDLAGKLSALYSYQLRSSVTTDVDASFTAWAPAATGTEPSLVYDKLSTIGTYFNTLLVSGEAATALGTIATAKIYYYEVFAWLNQDVTLTQLYGLLSGTALADKGDSCTFTVKFTFTLEAMQVAGNAPWSQFGS